MLDDDCTPGPEVLDALPVFPLPNVVLLPGMILPLNVFEPRYLALVDHVLGGGRHIGVPLLRPGFASDYDGRPEVESVFGIGRLVSHQALPDGRRFIRLEGLGRVRCCEELSARNAFREIRVEALPEPPPDDAQQFEVLKAQLERICTTLRNDARRVVGSVLQIRDSRTMLYAIAAIMPTLGYTTNADVERSPGQSDARSGLLELQQRCLDADTTDARVEQLLEGAAVICDRLADDGRWPNEHLN